jgi:signal transduction histidine kinase/CheY-like chemotaxis protein/HAMP domain-containing protein
MRLGLRFKQSLHIFLVSAIISTVTMVFAFVNQKQSIQEEFIGKGHSISRLLSATLVSPLYDFRIDQIDRLLSHVLGENDIKRAFALDQEGYILADGTKENRYSDELIHDVIANLPSRQVVLEDHPQDNSNTHIILAPVLAASGQYLGALVLELSLERANTQVQKLMYKMATISSVIILLALILAHVIASLLVTPLNEVTRVAEKITEGNYLIRLRNQRQDELGDLARTINRMASSLNTTTVSKDYVNSIILNMPVGLITLDQQGLIKQVNYYISALFDLEPSTIIGKSFIEQCHQVSAKKTSKPLREHDLTSNFTGECRFLINDVSFPVHITISEINQTDSQIDTLVVLHDISQQKAIESEREVALEKAQESTKLKADFLACMSHEIRTPMNGVLGLLSLLLHEPLSEKQNHYVTLALSSADTLLTLINDILDFSKIDADKLNIERIDFDIDALLGEFSESIAHQAQEKGLEIVLDQSGIAESHVVGDPTRLRQILTNLTGNAIKFTDAGEVVIKASMTKMDHDRLRFSCMITDTGIGISQDKVDHLFNPFTQADASTTRKYGGTGLGLAIANKLCEKMGHLPIQVKSTLGKGSQFSFSLDFSPSANSSDVSIQASLDQKTILVVDDNQHSSQAIASQLQKWGAKVEQSLDATSALNLLTSDEPETRNPVFDLIIIDRDMPNMNGNELAKTIRQDTRLNKVPLVMMTSIRPHHGEGKAFFNDLGVLTSFPKPATLSDLVNATNSAFGTAHDESTADIDTAPIPQKSELSSTPPRVLIVDDIIINQLIGSSLLEEFGYIADVVANGIEALDALNKPPDSTSENSTYQLILMDCQMPEMDGYEATRQIRADACGPEYAKIPIIAMTANAMKGDEEKCLEAGMDDYITKPVDPNILMAKLNLWINKPPLD